MAARKRVRAERVLALQVHATRLDILFGKRVHREGALGGTTLDLRGAKRQPGRKGDVQGIGTTEGVEAMACPRIIGRIGAHACVDRVEFDVAVAAQQASVTIYQGRFVDPPRPFLCGGNGP